MELYRYFLANDSTYIYAQSKNEAAFMYLDYYGMGDSNTLTVREVDPDTIVYNDIRGYDIPLRSYVQDKKRAQYIEVP